MRKKEILHYFEKEWKELRSSLKAYYKDQKPESLHQFRLQVKKLRALITLVESGGNKYPLSKRFKPVRRIFKKAGEIRDAYLHEKLTRKMKLGRTGIIKQQREIQDEAGNEFGAEKDKFFKDLAESHKSLTKKIRPLNDVHIIQYYDQVLQEVGKILAKPKFDEKLHGCRKLVKVLIYNHKLVRAVIEPAFNEDYLKDIETAIGDWHNLALALEFFAQRDIKNQTGITQLKNQARKLKADVRKLGKDFYQRARAVERSIPI